MTFNFTRMNEDELKVAAGLVMDGIADMLRAPLGRRFVIARRWHEGNNALEWCKSIQKSGENVYCDYDGIENYGEEAEFIRIDCIESFQRLYIPHDTDNYCYCFIVFDYKDKQYISPDALVFNKLIDDAFA